VRLVILLSPALWRASRILAEPLQVSVSLRPNWATNSLRSWRKAAVWGVQNHLP
jgi:hypothetical protein